MMFESHTVERLPSESMTRTPNSRRGEDHGLSLDSRESDKKMNGAGMVSDEGNASKRDQNTHVSPLASPPPASRTSPSDPASPPSRTSPSAPASPPSRTSPYAPASPPSRTSPSAPASPPSRTSPSPLPPAIVPQCPEEKLDKDIVLSVDLKPKCGWDALVDTATSENCPWLDKVLHEVYTEMVREDPNVKARALEAATERKQGLYSQKLTTIVTRRTPANPFTKQNNSSADLDSTTPLRGRLVVTLTTSAALLLVFLQSLMANKSLYGRFLAPTSINGLLGPYGRVFYTLGGLNTNAIRAGEWLRLFWASWLHAGWLHLFMNVLSQIQLFLMFEPDWGVFRCLTIFLGAAFTGNLISAVASPCYTTVGSSGGLFGLLGAMLPYCLEYWKSIQSPGCILAFTFLVVLVSFFMGTARNTDNWAHFGGLLAGILFGFLFVTRLTVFDEHSFFDIFPYIKKQMSHTAQAIRRFVARRILRQKKPQVESRHQSGTARETEYGTSVEMRRSLTQLERKKYLKAQKQHPKQNKPIRRSSFLRLFQRKTKPECSFERRETLGRLLSAFFLVSYNKSSFSSHITIGFCSLQVLTWIISLIFLFVIKLQPPGSLKFSSESSCQCCNYQALEIADADASLADATTRTYRYCFVGDEVQEGWRITWHEYCKIETQEEIDALKLPVIDHLGFKKYPCDPDQPPVTASKSGHHLVDAGRKETEAPYAYLATPQYLHSL